MVVAEDACWQIIREYTRESGVRNLEQQVAAICRKAARAIVSERRSHRFRSTAKVKEWLGPAKFRYGTAEVENQVGAVTGLAWTEVGGDTLVIEVTVLPGSGKLTLTGKLGDVMKESAQAAFSYTRSGRTNSASTRNSMRRNDIHIHIPEGAIPKDGPSAGITMATALISALTGGMSRRKLR